MSKKKHEHGAEAEAAAGAPDRQPDGLTEEVAAADTAAAADGAGRDPATGAGAAGDEVAEDPAEDAATDPALALEVENAELREELAQQRDRLLRAAAELENLRKRTRREVQEAHRFARAEVLRPLLEVLDNFDRALGHAADNGDAGVDDAFHQGVAMIAQSFRQVLRDQGVEPIAAVGEDFDPARHEAVGQQPAPEGTESGTVIAVVQEGYTLGDLVLRASRVIVAQ